MAPLPAPSTPASRPLYPRFRTLYPRFRTLYPRTPAPLFTPSTLDFSKQNGVGCVLSKVITSSRPMFKKHANLLICTWIFVHLTMGVSVNSYTNRHLCKNILSTSFKPLTSGDCPFMRNIFHIFISIGALFFLLTTLCLSSDCVFLQVDLSLFVFWVSLCSG